MIFQDNKKSSQDENWRALIEYAHSNGGYTGRAPFPTGTGDPDEAAVADRLERVFGEMNISDGAAAKEEEQGRTETDFISARLFTDVLKGEHIIS